MIRPIAVVAALMLALLPVQTARAQSTAQDAQDAHHALHQALQTSRLFDILAAESVDIAQDMARDAPDIYGPSWLARARALYDPRTMEARFRATLDARLTARPELARALTDFALSDLGARVIDLELDARVVLRDAQVLADTQARVTQAQDDPAQMARLAAVDAIIAGFDLVEVNTASALNQQLDFLLAFLEASGVADRALALDQVRAMEDDLRRETRAWLRAYLWLAYAPLPKEALDLLAEYAGDPAHQAFVRAQIAAFEAAFAGLSRQLGALSGQAAASPEL